MKRLAIALLIAVCAVPLFAQRRMPKFRSDANAILFQIQGNEETWSLMTTSVKRDSFIVSHVVAATAALNDFQKITAIEKARDLIKEARQKAEERPVASMETLTALSQIEDLLQHAHEQGATSDTAGLKRDIFTKSHPIQYGLFTELQEMAKERQILLDMQNRLSRVTAEMDAGTGEALASTFSYFQAGGQ